MTENGSGRQVIAGPFACVLHPRVLRKRTGCKRRRTVGLQAGVRYLAGERGTAGRLRVARREELPPWRQEELPPRPTAEERANERKGIRRDLSWSDPPGRGVTTPGDAVEMSGGGVHTGEPRNVAGAARSSCQRAPDGERNRRGERARSHVWRASATMRAFEIDVVCGLRGTGEQVHVHEYMKRTFDLRRLQPPVYRDGTADRNTMSVRAAWRSAVHGRISSPALSPLVAIASPRRGSARSGPRVRAAGRRAS